MKYTTMPCPACNQEAILQHSTYRFWILTCAHCDLEGAGNDAGAAYDALKRQAAARETQRLTKQ